jgi:class 3 adenylate cyclase/DNA-binding winged helix-turn-helix (wHTH) protein/tetratricopeptide (TPR) repeat protein
MLYVFEGYTLDTRRYELRRGGMQVPVEPQVLNVLMYLVQHRDRVVSRAELFEHLWPEQYVSDAALERCIAAVRRAIGDSGRVQHRIKTLRGRGYRCIAEVEEILPQEQGVSSSFGPSTLCPVCQYGNDAEALFCVVCGTAMVVACSGCGRLVSQPATFCPTCGRPLADTPSAFVSSSSEGASLDQSSEPGASDSSLPASERKQVTVLSCALDDAPALLERLGAEAWHPLLNDFFALALRTVQQYGGTIRQFLDDGFTALFGAPVAYEDHAQRAILAATGLRHNLAEVPSSLGGPAEENLAVSIGLHTGLVIVGTPGTSSQPNYTAVGDTISLATDLVKDACRGQIVCSASTYRLASNSVSARPRDRGDRPGQGELVQTWEVITVREGRSRLEAGSERGLTPFVSRERELRLMSDCLARAQSGRGQLLFIVGEPGIGKSRLLIEFRRRLDTEVNWLEGRALSFGQSVAFHPLIDLLRRYFQIETGEAEDTIGARIGQAVLQLGEELQPIIPYLRYLLAIDPGDARVQHLDPRLRRMEIFHALRHLILRIAGERPLVLVFEDLHWIDRATEEFLSFVSTSFATSKVLCMFTYRPGYTHTFADQTYHTRIGLTTLSAADSARMIQALLATTHLPQELEALIVRKAEGNPFFVEEMVTSLRESGLLRPEGHRYVLTRPYETRDVPDTIQDVLIARIDRLEEAPKKTLQLAAVIGREFAHRLLDRLGDKPQRNAAYLQKLKALELIYDKELFPEPAYAFKHALTHEVAYNSLLAQQRKALHVRIGRAIEELYADRLAEQYEVLAYHFMQGEQWCEALAYLVRAAEKATQAFANREALTLYDQALEAAARLGPEVESRTGRGIHRAKAALYTILSDFESARAEHERVLILARQAGDRTEEGMALAGMGTASFWAHDFARALHYTHQAIAVAETVEARSVLASSYFTTCLVHGVTGRINQAHRDIERALTVSRSVGDTARQAFPLAFAGLLKNHQGEYGAASRLNAESLRLSREHGLFFPLLYGLFVQGITLTGKGEYDAAYTTFEEGLTLSEKVGDEVQRHRLLNSFGWLYMELGNLDLALSLNRQGLERARQLGYPEPIANALINIGDIFLAQHDVALAQEFFDEAYRLVRDPATTDWMKWRYSMRLYASLGRLWLVRGDPAKAREWTGRCLHLASQTDSRKNLIKGWRLQGEIARVCHQRDEARQWLQQALELAQTVGNPPQLWQTYSALGRLHDETAQPEMARWAYRNAHEIRGRIKATIQLPELRASLK